jgi:hypothetical protein
MVSPARKRLLALSLCLAMGGGLGATALAQNPFAAPPGEPPPAPADAAAPVNPFAAPPDAPPAEPMNPFASDAAALPPAPEADPAPATFEPSFGATSNPFEATPDPDDAMAAPDPAAPEEAAAPADTAAAANPFSFGGAAPATDSTAPAATTESSAPFTFASPSTAAGEGGRGISQLFTFRFVVKLGRDGRQIVTRQRLTREEAEIFDNELKAYFRGVVDSGEAPNFQAGANNPDEWAEWLAYANQLQLWTTYVRDVVLVGTGYEFDPATQLPWPYDVQQEREQQLAAEQGRNAGDQGGLSGEHEGGRPQAPADIRNENRSLDDQLADFSIVPDTRQGSQGAAVIDPAQMDEASVALYKQFNSTLRSFEQEQVDFMKRFKDDLEKRKQKREAYAEWRQNQKELILEYLEEWSRRYEGQVVTIAGVRYELFKPGNVPSNVTRGANVVITDYDITPYDLLDETGRLRGPSRQLATSTSPKYSRAGAFSMHRPFLFCCPVTGTSQHNPPHHKERHRMGRYDEEDDDGIWEEGDDEEEESGDGNDEELDALIEETTEYVETGEARKAIRLWKRSMDRFADEPPRLFPPRRCLPALSGGGIGRPQAHRCGCRSASVLRRRGLCLRGSRPPWSRRTPRP